MFLDLVAVVLTLFERSTKPAVALVFLFFLVGDVVFLDLREGEILFLEVELNFISLDFAAAGSEIST